MKRLMLIVTIFIMSVWCVSAYAYYDVTSLHTKDNPSNEGFVKEKVAPSWAVRISELGKATINGIVCQWDKASNSWKPMPEQPVKLPVPPMY